MEEVGQFAQSQLTMRDEIDTLRGRMDLLLEAILARYRRDEELRWVADANALANSSDLQKGASDSKVPHPKRPKEAQPTVNEEPT